MSVPSHSTPGDKTRRHIPWDQENCHVTSLNKTVLDLCCTQGAVAPRRETESRGMGCHPKEVNRPQPVWLSGLSAGLQIKGSWVRFPVRAHAWVVGRVPSRGHSRGNHTLMFLSLSFSLPSPFSKNK